MPILREAAEVDESISSGTVKTMREKTFSVLQLLARSSWGFQGAGICNDDHVFIELVRLGYARPLMGEKKKVLAVTLRGFRFLYEEADNHHRKDQKQEPEL